MFRFCGDSTKEAGIQMISIVPVRILFFVVSFILINHSSQLEIFEDAVKRETLVPELDARFLSNIDEDDTEEPYQEYNGPPSIPARDDEPPETEEVQEQEDGDAERRAGNSLDGNIDSQFSQEVPEFNEEEEDEDIDEEDGKAPYNDEEREIDESAKKRSDLEKFEHNADTSKKITKSKKLKTVNKKSKVKSSLDREKASKKSSVQKRNTRKVGAKVSTNKNEESKSKKEEDSPISESSSGEGSVGSGNESSWDVESSGAERERRQAFQTEDQVMKAKEKLKNAQVASDALTSIEKEMGLDPSVAPEKTKNLTSALHSEIQKFNDIISQQNDDVKKSKFKKLEKLAEEDVNGANDVMKLIVELEVAKFFAKHRARKKLEVVLRNKITNPPSPPEPAAPAAPGFAGMGQFQNQAGMADFMPQIQEQNFNSPNPYAPFADEPQPPPQQASQQAPAMPFPSAPQVPFQPSPMAPAYFQPAPLPSGPFQGALPAPNPLQGQYQDSNLPPRWSPQAASFAPVPQAPQEYNPYVANPMRFAPANFMPQPNPQPQQQPNVVNNPPMEIPAHKVVKVAPKHKITEKKPQLKPPQPQPQPHQASYLPQSSPFSGIKPLQSLSPVRQPVPSYSTEMQSQTAPFSSYTQNPFAVSSAHPYSDAFAPPPPQPNTQAFYPQSSWASPPPQVNRFSDSLSHLNPHFQKPAATFKPVSPSPPVQAGQHPHPPDLSKMLKDLARYRSRPITAHQIRPVPAVQAPEPPRLHEPSPPAPQTPPMYSQFDFPGQPEPAISIQQPAPQFAPPSPQYYQPVPQVPQMPFVSPQTPMPAPLPIQDHAPTMQYSNEQKSNDGDEDEDEDFNPMDQQFNDNVNPAPQPVGLQYQGPAVYPQQQQPMQQAYSGYNAWSNPGISGNTESFPWTQNPNPQAYGYQPAPSYEQIVNPMLTEALNKVHDTKQAATVVQKIENTIGLSPPAVNHIINDVESETNKEKIQFDQDIKNDEDEIQKDKNLINDESTNKEDIQKKIEEKKKKLDEDKKRDEVAKTKLATIKKIEKILTIIETAKYSALKRAKEHLMKLKTEKDPQIRKRDLETLEKDLKKSEVNHLHRRNEINIWLKGSRNNINTSHFLEGKRKTKEAQKRNYNAFGSPSIPKLAIARFSAKLAKKSKIDAPANSSVHNSEASKEKTVKKPKIGVILMRKLLQRMDDLYDMQSKILTQLIKDHQKVKDEKEKNRRKRNIHSAHHRHHPHANHHRHHHHSR